MLSKVPTGSRIFIDSNIFIYHFLGLEDSCTQLLARIEEEEVKGFTSVIVLAEVWHRLMVAECIEMYKVSPRKATSYLKSNPEKVKKLTRCQEAISSIPKMKISIWSLTRKAFSLAQTISQEYGLLTNDSLNLALMRQHRIKNIATNDTDFQRVKNINFWKPSA